MSNLPYGGDMNEAMRQEDRDAVRILLKERGEKEERAVVEKTKKTVKKRRKWWEKLSDVDPISLEPLSELEYPPFELNKHYFDGRILAFYLVSTGTFVHPMSREEMTLVQCKELDTYLKKYKLKEARVAEAFSLQKRMSSSPDLIEQRRQATAILHGLFGFARYGGSSLRSGFEDDEATLQEEEEAEELPGSFPTEEDEEKEDFPALLDESTEQATQIQARHQSDWRNTVESRQVVRPQDFPQLSETPVTSTGVEPPRFRNAVLSYRLEAHTAQSPAQASGYAAAAAAVSDFPRLATTQKQRKRASKENSIVAQIRTARGDSVLASLREKSLEYRRGDLSAESFYSAGQTLLQDSFDDLFPGLVALLPDPQSRAILQSLITQKRLARYGHTPPPPQPSFSPRPPQQQSPPRPPPQRQPPPRQSEFPGLSPVSSLPPQPPQQAIKKKSGPKKTAAPGWQKALAQYSKASSAGKKKSSGVSIVIPKNRPKQPPPPGASM